MPVAIYLKGALEPVYLNEPMHATSLNMSAAMNNNLMFFKGTNTDGQEVVIAINQILYMVEGDDD